MLSSITCFNVFKQLGDEHDEEICNNAEKYNALTHAQRVGLQMRLSEKRIYHKAIQQSSKWATSLPTFQIGTL